MSMSSLSLPIVCSLHSHVRLICYFIDLIVLGPVLVMMEYIMLLTVMRKRSKESAVHWRLELTTSEILETSNRRLGC